ncbi:3-methyl-2-oxobutanoate hydroxymethyltransferase [Streptomyces thinghirensis]|nr:3-methyl-2-oxobutanoate hydroxymethyltransferase [Streptomyces thinghirensis]
MPAELAAEVTRTLHILTVDIGAGPETDAQVLVWTDMLGLTGGRMPSSSSSSRPASGHRRRGEGVLAEDVVGGTFPQGGALRPLSHQRDDTGPADLPPSAGPVLLAGSPSPRLFVPSAGCRRCRTAVGGMSAVCRRGLTTSSA